MKKLKVMTIVGTRPEIIKLSEVIKKNDKYFDHILVHTGQNYDYTLNDVFFEDLGIRAPDFYLGVVGDSLGQTMGNVIAKSYEIMVQEKPDALLVLGDTNSCLSVISAKRLKIPIFHMEAGNRCFDQRVPEEVNRKIVDHISDMNLTYSDIAREHLISEGIHSDRVIKTGSPMSEVISNKANQICESEILTRLGLVKNEYFVVSAHREENINSEQNFNDLVVSLDAIVTKYDIPVIFSTHPRTLKMINEENIIFNPLVKIMKPFGFNDYIALQINSKAVLSDSGTISEESSILGFRALNLRQTHERPEAMEEAAVMLVGLKSNRILQGLEILESQYNNTLNITRDYNSSNVSEKVVRIILSYTDYINRIVWGKYT